MHWFCFTHYNKWTSHWTKSWWVKTPSPSHCKETWGKVTPTSLKWPAGGLKKNPGFIPFCVTLCNNRPQETTLCGSSHYERWRVISTPGSGVLQPHCCSHGSPVWVRPPPNGRWVRAGRQVQPADEGNITVTGKEKTNWCRCGTSLQLFTWHLPHQHLCCLSLALQLAACLQLTLFCSCELPSARVCVCVPGSHLGHLAGLYKYHTGGSSLTGFSQLAVARELPCTLLTAHTLHTRIRPLLQ